MAGVPRASTALAHWGMRWRQHLWRQAPADRDSVTLRHSRIYILPTRRGLALIATVAVMLVTSLNYGLALGFAATFLLSGLIAAALVHTFRNLAGVELRPGVAGESFAPGRVPFSLAIGAGTRTRVALSVATREGVRCILDVDAHALRTAAFDVAAPVRGTVELGRVTLASDYPLGLWRGWAYVHFPSRGLAYPAPELGAPALPASVSGTDASTRGRTEDADLAGLRDYQRGDPLQRVAWKAVARGAGWYSKAFDGAGGAGPVVLDYDQLSATLDCEARLSRLTAWVLACERTSRPFALALPGRHIAAGQGRAHRSSVLSALALFEG